MCLRVAKWACAITLLSGHHSFAQESQQSICTGSEQCGQFAGAWGAVGIGLVGLLGPHFLKDPMQLSFPSNTFVSAGTDKLAAVEMNFRSAFGRSIWALDTSASAEAHGKNLPILLNYAIGVGATLPTSNSLSFYPSLRLAIQHVENLTRERFGPELGSQMLYRDNDHWAYGAGASVRYIDDVAWKVFLVLHQLNVRLGDSKKDNFIYSIGHSQDNFLGTHSYFVSVGSSF